VHDRKDAGSLKILALDGLVVGKYARDSLVTGNDGSGM
jgi:hypothetical protein